MFFPAKRRSSNLPFGAMMSSMTLHDIVVQCKDAGTRGRTYGRGRMLTDTHGCCGQQWEGVEGRRGMHGAALQRHGVLCRVFVVDYERARPRTR
jgi:hypothetical protein